MQDRDFIDIEKWIQGKKKLYKGVGLRAQS